MAGKRQIVISRNEAGLSSTDIPGVGISHMLMVQLGQLDARLAAQAEGLADDRPGHSHGHGSNAPFLDRVETPFVAMPAACYGKVITALLTMKAHRGNLASGSCLDFSSGHIPPWAASTRAAASGPPTP